MSASETIHGVSNSIPSSTLIEASDDDSSGIVRGVRKGYDDREVSMEDDDGVIGELPLITPRSNASVHLPSISSSSSSAATVDQSQQQSSIFPTTNQQSLTAEKVNDSTMPTGPVYRSKSMRFIVTPELSEYADSVGFNDAIALYRNAAQLSMNNSNGTTTSGKSARGQAEGILRSKILKEIVNHPVWGQNTIHIVQRNMAAEAVMKKAFRHVLLSDVLVQRVDGRGLTQLRPLGSFVDVLPIVHGSSFFQRGDTHVLCTVTLGGKQDAKRHLLLNGMSEEQNEMFYLHYDFPPYCTGDVGNATSLNRRMIGHGNLAERALRPVMPKAEVLSVVDELNNNNNNNNNNNTATATTSSFPYTVRVYAECTSSNGSSSMASACGATLGNLSQPILTYTYLY